MTDVRSRGQLAAQGFDANGNGQVEELTLSASVREEVGRGASTLSVADLAAAIDRDQVVIRNGNVQSARGQTPHVRGRETLQSIHDQAASSVSAARMYTWDAHVYYATPQTAEEYNQMKHEYRRATAEFKGAAFGLRTTLSSIEMQAGRQDDSTSRAVRSTAQTALRYDFWNNFDSWLNNDVFGDDGRNSYERARDRYNTARHEYGNLESAVTTIRNTTDDLPDPAGQLTRFQRGVSTTSGTLTQLEGAQRSISVADVQARLRQQAGGERSQVTGRAAPYGGIGAAVGAVAGGVAGFAAGKNAQSGAIGAAIGAAVAGGIGALIGHSKDKGHERRANDLDSLSQEVASYSTTNAFQRLSQLAAQGEVQSGAARQSLDLDTARGVSNNLGSTATQVETVNTQASRILSAYQR